MSLLSRCGQRDSASLPWGNSAARAPLAALAFRGTNLPTYAFTDGCPWAGPQPPSSADPCAGRPITHANCPALTDGAFFAAAACARWRAMRKSAMGATWTPAAGIALGGP